MTDPYEEFSRRPLEEHLADHERYLKAKGNTASHVSLTVARIQAVLNGCQFARIPDISSSIDNPGAQRAPEAPTKKTLFLRGLMRIAIRC